MKKILSALVLSAVATVVAPAAIFNFYTPLGPEAPGATGTGFATFTFDTTLQTLDMDFSWSGLSGVTTVSHIHCCTAVPGTGTIGVAVTPTTFPNFPAGLSAGSYSRTLDLTAATTYTGSFLGMLTPAEASAKLLQGILDGEAYLNIHSTTFMGGEIRGFLAPVPEPATFLLSGVTFAGLFVARRYCSR